MIGSGPAGLNESNIESRWSELVSATGQIPEMKLITQTGTFTVASPPTIAIDLLDPGTYRSSNDRQLIPMRRTTISALLLLLVAGPVAAQRGAAADPSLVRYRVRPSSIDSTVNRFDDPHYVVFDRAVKADAPLLLFLPGTGGQPQNTSFFQDLAAQQGYRVIGLQYVDADAVVEHCTVDRDPDCSEKIRRKRIFGENVTPLIDDRPSEAIVARLTVLLQVLDRQHPAEGWGQYLRNGSVEWSRIAVSGLSQGAGMAAYIAQRTPVARVILFSSPWDNYGRRRLAPWILRGPGATPSDRWYAAYHAKENTAELIKESYAALRIPSSHIHVLNLESLAKKPQNPFHPSVVSNPATPRKADGTPAYLEQWRALLGDVR